MMKKMILLSVLAVALTGCVVAPYDNDYPRDGRPHSGPHGDRDHHSDRDRDGYPDWRHQNRQGDDRQSDGRFLY